MTALVLGLPSKGRMMDDCFGWFAARGVPVERTGDGRAYTARTGFDGIEIALLSASEIPGELARGRIHLGVTGEDVVRERIVDWSRRVARMARLGFGRADLVVAVPSFWIDVETMADLDEVAARFRATHGRALRVATKYHGLARAFFHEKGVADYRLVDSQGATEAAPRNMAAEAIVDITSTGATLDANGLRVLDDGLILESEACLWLARGADWSAGREAHLRALAARLGVPPPA